MVYLATYQQKSFVTSQIQTETDRADKLRPTERIARMRRTKMKKKTAQREESDMCGSAGRDDRSQ